MLRYVTATSLDETRPRDESGQPSNGQRQQGRNGRAGASVGSTVGRGPYGHGHGARKAEGHAGDEGEVKRAGVAAAAGGGRCCGR